MDANGLTFFQLADGAHWRSREHLRWDAGCRALALASERTLDAPVDAGAFAAAGAALDAVPRAVDAFDTVARWDDAAAAVVVHSHLPVDAVLLPLAGRPSDLAVGADGVLYVAQAAGVLLHDLRGRFVDAFVPTPGFVPWRIEPAGPTDATVVWLLERTTGRLARLTGRPLPDLRPRPDDYSPGVFRPSPENCRPPRVEVLDGIVWPAGERPVALAAAPDARLALLSWGVDGAALLRVLQGGGSGEPFTADEGNGSDDAGGTGSTSGTGNAGGTRSTSGTGSAGSTGGTDNDRRVDPATASLAQTLGPPLALAGARYAYALAWLDAARIAVRMPGRRDAPAFDLQPWRDAQAVALDPPASALPLGEAYPLATDAAEAPFAHRLQGPPRYPLGPAAAVPGAAEQLLPLSLNRLARHGTATHWRTGADGLDAHWLDAGRPGTVWHRLNAEASIPAGTGFVVWAAATETPAPPDDGDALAWQPHGFGADVATLAPAAMAGPVPRAAWERLPSELPGHPGLAPWTPERDRRGLFGVLLQNARQRVRKLAGRYLWLRVEVFGDGRATPEIVALRAWAGRFDYVDQYLPRLYRETFYGAPAEAPGEPVGTLAAGLGAGRIAALAAALDAGDLTDADLAAELAALPRAVWQGTTAASSPASGEAGGAGGTGGPPPALTVQIDVPGSRWRLVDAAGRRSWPLTREAGGIVAWRPRATPADFLSRLLANVEGVLTPLEDRIAAAHVLTHPATVPDARLDWLAGWIGVAFDDALPAERRRDWLAEAPRLACWHGTRRGLALALDVATGGGVRGGEIVVLEDFRLRRLLTTLLGVDLADEDDPLMPGLHRSGNSVVGDTLFLGDEATAELMALYRADAATTAENDAVLAFYGKLAHRATVLVHTAVERQDLGLIRRIAELEAPAHVEVRVERATWPLLVGVSSLVGVDTYLGPPRKARPARVQRSVLGMGDFILQSASLDPRLAGQAAAPVPDAALRPVANAGADRAVPSGASFTLDAGGSRAAPGRSLDQYVWRRLPPDA